MNSYIDFQTTPAMINFVVDNMETGLDKAVLKKMISETYNEAIELAKL